MGQKDKLFKDPVHGYISVPREWCSKFIDTPIFQRLRHIEQTSMRPLYPAAHHDRFIHSLGVFHLASMLYENLENNSDSEIKKILKRDDFKNTFLISSLMHDCGHAPFSHTFEKFYNHTEAKTGQRAFNLLKEEFPGKDFVVGEGFDPAPHEAFSAVVLNRFYSDELNDYHCDPELAARMITGCTYPDETDLEARISNRLISLLNGNAIDVDKLDYILRDTWASGVQNTAIDIDRLLSSVMFRRDARGETQLCFDKSALSVLQNVVDARNYLYEWIYNHHTVLYYSKLLDRTLRKVAEHLSQPDDPDSFWKSIFSLEPFRSPVKIDESRTIYLPTDGDIINIMKQFSEIIPLPDMEELLSHAPKRIALWKTLAEFRMHFKEAPVADPSICASVSKRLPETISDRLGCDPDDVLVIPSLLKHYHIEEQDVLIYMGNGHKTFVDIIGEKWGRKPMKFFYVFIPPKYKEKKDELIDLIRDQRR